MNGLASESGLHGWLFNVNGHRKPVAVVDVVDPELIAGDPAQPHDLVHRRDVLRAGLDAGEAVGAVVDPVRVVGEVVEALLRPSVARVADESVGLGEGGGPDDTSYYRLIDVTSQIGFRLADVTARWPNRNAMDSSGHGITVVNLTAIEGGAAGYQPEPCKYKLGFGPTTDVIVVDDDSPDGTADLARSVGAELGGDIDVEVGLPAGAVAGDVLVVGDDDVAADTVGVNLRNDMVPEGGEDVERDVPRLELSEERARLAAARTAAPF